MLSRSDKDKILHAIPGWAEYVEALGGQRSGGTRAPAGRGAWQTKENRDLAVAWLRANRRYSLWTVCNTPLVGLTEVVRKVCMSLTRLHARGTIPAHVRAEFGDLLDVRNVALEEPERLRRYVKYVRNGGVISHAPWVRAVYIGLYKRCKTGVFSQQTADILGDLLPKWAKVEAHAPRMLGDSWEK